MNVKAFIPSRYDSSRFPGKPLTLIAGEPMILHVYRCASSCPEISEVFVATDDERIFKCVTDSGGNAIITTGNHPSGTDRIAEAIKKLDMDDDDLIVNIQGDQPAFNPSLISHMIAPLVADKGIQMGTLKHRIKDRDDINNSNIVKVITDFNDYALYFSRCPIPFPRDSHCDRVHYKHLGFYVYRKDFLVRFSNLPCGNLESIEKLEQLRALEHGFKIKVVETEFDSLEVDTPDDIKKVEKLLNSLSNA